MKLRLSIKAMGTLMCLVLVAVVGSSIALVYVWREKRMIDEMVSTRVGDLVLVAELDAALLKQRGLTAAYLIDRGGGKWIADLDRLEPVFRDILDRLWHSSDSERDRALVREARKSFERYVLMRRKMLALYEGGDEEAAVELYLGELGEVYREAAAACDSIVQASNRDIERIFSEERSELGRLTAVMAASGAMVAVLGLALLWLLFTSVFVPLKRMARDMGAVSGGGSFSGDDLDSLQYHLKELLEEISRTRSDRQAHPGGDEHTDRLAAVGNAVAYIAHEIRNRLAMVGGYARLIEKHPDDRETAAEGARIIFQSSSRLEQMLTEVMEFSRPMTGHRSAHSLNDLVRGTMATLVAGAPPGVTMNIEIDEDAPRVVVDPTALEQVVINLVRNACEALEHGGSITVSTKRSAAGALLIVSDDGPGIPEDIRGKIFEPFFTTKKSGNGLGLSICRKLVSENGGDLSLVSEPAGGATFVVTLRDTAA